MDLANLDAVATAQKIADREITAREALDAAIARAEAVNPQINAFTNTYFDRARELTPPAGPLSGVPFLVKDLLDWEGAVTSFGSVAFKNYVADSQTPYMDAFLAAGLAPFAKTTTPEMGLLASTEPLLSGATRNPWNLDHIPGGSSGGAAAAVAAGIVPIAHASDGGGSIRIPASCCGLFGLKPSRNRLAEDNRDAPVRISTQHAVSRTVRDSAVLFAATERTGEDREYEPIGVVTGPSSRRLKIGIAIDPISGAAVHPDVRAAAEDVAALCREMGHETMDVSIPIDGGAFSDAFMLYWAAGAATFAQSASDYLGEPPGPSFLEPWTLSLTQLFASEPQEKFNAAVAQLFIAEAAYDSMFPAIDVLMTPTVATPPPKIGETAPTVPFDQLLERTNAFAAYTPIQNAAGAPAMSVPLAMSSDGLPIGLHFAARKGDDKTLFELAFEFEQTRPWIDKKPPVYA